MKDQALKLRQLATERQEVPYPPIPNLSGLTRSPYTIAVTSGKGGVGKTSLTINLGVALASRGKRVVILDADLGLANINVALGLKVRYTLLDVLAGSRSIEDCILEGPAGILVIPGVSGVAEMANITDAQRQRLIKALGAATRKADVLLVDTGAGLSKNVLEFALLADMVVVVTVPEPPAIADAYGIIKALVKENPGIDIRLLINRATSEFEAKGVYDRLSLVVRRFLSARIECVGSVHDDPVVGEAVRNQQPFFLTYPSAPASLDVRECVGRIFADLAPGRGILAGFLDRIKALWA